MAILPEQAPSPQTTGRRPWPRNPRYLVGDDGTILGPKGEIVNGGITKDGHRTITVILPGGQSLCTGQHVVVCETFHGPRPEGKQVAHGDGDPLNNRPDNLSWKTPVGNRHDRLRHGTYGSKLTADRVREIRANPDVSASEFARRYGCSRSMISHVRSGRSWTVVES